LFRFLLSLKVTFQEKRQKFFPSRKFSFSFNASRKPPTRLSCSFEVSTVTLQKGPPLSCPFLFSFRRPTRHFFARRECAAPTVCPVRLFPERPPFPSCLVPFLQIQGPVSSGSTCTTLCHVCNDEACGGCYSFLRISPLPSPSFRPTSVPLITCSEIFAFQELYHTWKRAHPSISCRYFLSIQSPPYFHFNFLH